MNASPIHTIVYVEDSDDEVYLARRILKRQHPMLQLLHFDRLERFVDALHSELELDAMATMIVLDLNLKLGNGNDGIRMLRHQPQLAGALMGVCTGSRDPADRQEGSDAGADFFIHKPLLPDGLQTICGIVDALRWVPDSEDGFAMQRTDQ